MCAALGKLGFKTLCHTNVRDRAEFDALVKDRWRLVAMSHILDAAPLLPGISKACAQSK
jgi:hypothetical protein